MIRAKSLVLAIGLLMLQACATVYTDENFSNYQSKHKTVAVLPFEVSIDQKNLPKDVRVDMLKESERSEGYLFQQQLYTQFLNRMQKGHYTVDFQPVDKTNVLLKRAGIEYEELDSHTKGELGRLLGVDSVITGDIKRAKPMGTGAAVASTFLVGFGATNKVVVNMSLYDAETGNMIWTYDHQQAGGLGSSPDRLAKNLMKNSASKFPYKTSN